MIDLTMINLDGDSLILIIEYLPAVNRHLRHLYFLTSIAKVSWRWFNVSRRTPLLPPPSVGHYIGEMDFVITQQRGRPTMLDLVEKYKEPISNSMSTRAPAFHALHTIQIKVTDEHGADQKQLFIGPWWTFVEAIFLLPALETLELEAPWFSEDETFPSLT
ncbi:hypothetical protein EDD18DRAFT_1346753 [Armillaria luteobubalina]|uniref:Uncharacterized protein n=1 Tax=Armillaria luteobubalina TaxID=153913 RepID=A0AA39QHX5_9AGAR|nr:hypothetical protein EDD18DRAFT_1346753 [Armillaria luteobubalina]